MDNREVLLEVKNVSKIYGDLHALKEVNFQVRKGEWVAIMGSSGSGKSTIMNIIGCMDKPTMGEVILDGQDITKESQNSLTKIRREKIGELSLGDLPEGKYRELTKQEVEYLYSI